MLRLIQFKVVYIMEGTPRNYMTRAENGFEAEMQFLDWAKDLTRPVRVVRVESVVI